MLSGEVRRDEDDETSSTEKEDPVERTLLLVESTDVAAKEERKTRKMVTLWLPMAFLSGGCRTLVRKCVGERGYGNTN